MAPLKGLAWILILSSMMHLVLVGQHLFAMDSFDGKYVDGEK